MIGRPIGVDEKYKYFGSFWKSMWFDFKTQMWFKVKDVIGENCKNCIYENLWHFLWVVLKSHFYATLRNRIKNDKLHD